MMIVPAFQVTIINEQSIAYRKYKKFRLPPPNIYRGRCRKCEKPFIETWGIGPAKVLVFIPVSGFKDTVFRQPEAHLFYEHRVHDVDDSVPKSLGYFRSQWALAKMITNSFL